MVACALIGGKLTFRELFSGWVVDSRSHFLNWDQEVSSVSCHSQEVEPGSLFVAIRGTQKNGLQFVPEALSRGASLVLTDALLEQGPYFYHPDPREALALLAGRFYGNPSHAMVMVGVTGTSGKTTSTYLLESMFEAAGYRVGLLGGVEIRFGNERMSPTHTTSDAVTLQKTLARMRDAGCQVVVMEVSSHALRQKRVHGIAWDGVLFTNLSAEHLDFHEGMEDYFQAKSILFEEAIDFSYACQKNPWAVIHRDDPYGARLVRALEKRNCLSFSGTEMEGVLSLSGWSGRLGGVWVESPLVGHFNALNLLGAWRLAQVLGVSPEQMASGVKKLQKVPGRLERISRGGIHVWIDYAHKPDALAKVLEVLRSLNPSRLYCVFGCGGDRDRKKRPLMGKIACLGADCVVLTSDNPRTEDPQRILQEIVSGVDQSEVHVELDRKKAIEFALREAQSGDFVLIAGKGHERYQIFGQDSFPFDDVEVVEAFFYNA